jgi:hypothetical protein
MSGKCSDGSEAWQGRHFDRKDNKRSARDSDGGVEMKLKKPKPLWVRLRDQMEIASKIYDIEAEVTEDGKELHTSQRNGAITRLPRDFVWRPQERPCDRLERCG